MLAGRMDFIFFILLNIFISKPLPALCKSTIEPCDNSETCNALVGYTLYADLKVAEVGALFNLDPIALLAANAIDISSSDVENQILPAGAFLRVPVICSCDGGIRKSVSVRYRSRSADTLASIAGSVYSGLVTADQILAANDISDPSEIVAGQNLIVPLPCTCFNSTDSMLPAVYMSYVVKRRDSVAAIAAAYSTTISDIMNANAMASASINPGDIIAIPLPACISKLSRFSSDYGLIVANGSYAITGSHCVQCSCGPRNLALYCTFSPLAVSCPSMQCRNSDLVIGNVTSDSTTAGCLVTSCSYAGFFNGSILTSMSTTLQPRCPGPREFPALLPLPSASSLDTFLAPSPAPSLGGGDLPTAPKTSPPAAVVLSGGGPVGSISGDFSSLSPPLITPPSLLSLLLFLL